MFINQNATSRPKKRSFNRRAIKILEWCQFSRWAIKNYVYKKIFLNLTWQSKNVVFECPIGSFTGAHTFKSALAFGKGLDVPYKKILQALSQEDQLVMAMNRKLNWEKRSYNVSHSNESAEIGKSNY